MNRWCVTVPGEKIPAICENGLWRCISTSEDKDNLWDFETAASCVAEYPDRQIGFVLCEGDGFTCVDFDIKDDEPVGGSIFNNRTMLVDEFGRDTYVEVSSSGCGYHVWLKGEVKAAIKQSWYEVYSKERFIVCTGNRVSLAAKVAWDQDAISNFNKIADSRQVVAIEDEAPIMSTEALLERLEAWAPWQSFVSGNWEALGKSGSEADHMLMGYVVHFTGNFQQAYSIWKETALAVLTLRYPDAGIRRKKAREWMNEGNIVRKLTASFKKCLSAAIQKGDRMKPEDMVMKQEVQQAVEHAINNGDNPFARFNLMPHLKQLEEKVRDAVYLDADNEFLAYGQTTILFARPNVGKTLLAGWLLEQSYEQGKDLTKVIYIDADNGVGQALGRMKALQAAGMTYIIPGVGFNDKIASTELVKETMQQMIAKQATEGYFIILDTLKKFTSIMKKDEYSKFMSLCRQFTAGGGGILLMSHTNKNKGEDGKDVMSGTADGLQDADCVYKLERIADAEPGYDYIEMEAEKIRLPVTRKATFRIMSAACRNRSTTYDDILETVARLESDEADKNKERAQQALRQSKDAELIKVITEYMVFSIRPGATCTDNQGVFVSNLRAHLKANYPHLDKSDKGLRNILRDGNNFYWLEVSLVGKNSKGYAPLSRIGVKTNA